jgi:hypothetical protein
MAREGKARLNIWIPEELMGWLEVESNRLGIPLTAFVVVKLQQARQDDEVKRELPKLGEWLAKLEALSKAQELSAEVGGRRDNG